MCGILGSTSFHKDSFFIDIALSLLNDRGPDNSSFIVVDDLCLAHTRLSIVDHDSRSNQPFPLAVILIVS